MVTTRFAAAAIVAEKAKKEETKEGDKKEEEEKKEDKQEDSNESSCESSCSSSGYKGEPFPWPATNYASDDSERTVVVIKKVIKK